MAAGVNSDSWRKPNGEWTVGRGEQKKPNFAAFAKKGMGVSAAGQKPKAAAKTRVEDCCGLCDCPKSRCRCDEKCCKYCDYPEEDCHCHLIDRCCPDCGSDGQCYCDMEPTRVHYCGDADCDGDCGALSCGCWDTCRNRCGKRGGF